MAIIKAPGAIQDSKDKIIVVRKPPKNLTASNMVRINDEAYDCLKEIEQLSGVTISQIASTLITFAYQNIEIVDWDEEAK